jgi:hypothetical protein
MVVLTFLEVKHLDEWEPNRGSQCNRREHRQDFG